MSKKSIIKRYILLNIFLKKWKPGLKIPSAQQLAIKFDISLLTIKKELSNFKKNNILISKPKKGFFVHPDLYDLVPLSIRKKYSLEYKGTKLNKTEYGSFVKKEYFSSKTNADIWVDSKIYSDIFNHSKYLYKNDFMYNLTWNGVIIKKIILEKRIKIEKNQKYLVENRKMYDLDGILRVDEDIYVPYEIWFDSEKWEF